jgi:hypothetical protein
MTFRETIRRLGSNPLQIIALLTLLQLEVTLLTDGFALSFDEAMWHYIGRNWFRHDLIPYAGGVDNKSPLIFAIFGLSDKLFGVNYWFPRILGTVCQSVGIYYIYKIARHMAGEQAGILAISFYGLSQMWHATGGRYVSFTETYDIMFIVVAFYKFISGQNKKDLFISGLLAGIGFGFRLSAIFGIAVIFIGCLRKGWAHTLVFCAGVITTVLILCGLGLLAGIDLHNVLIFGLTDNFGTGSTTDHPLMWQLENFSDKFFYSELILFYPLILGYFFIKKKADLLLLWLVLEFIGIILVGKYGALHLKELLPAFSLISALCVTHLIDVYKVPARPLIIIIWLIFMPKLLEPFVILKRILTADKGIPEQICREPYTIPNEEGRKRLGWWVRDNTSVRDKVFVAGFGAQVQVYTERISPTIYFNVTQTQMAKGRFYHDLKANKPAMILVPLFSQYRDLVSGDMRLFLDQLVAKEYYLDRCMYNYNIYRVKATH